MINMPSETPSMNPESKYSLVVAVAKRARQIIARREPGATLAHKAVTIAMEEIEQGRVRVVTKPEAEGEREGSVETQEIQVVQEPQEVQEPQVIEEAPAAPEIQAAEEAAAGQTPAAPEPPEGKETGKPKL